MGQSTENESRKVGAPASWLLLAVLVLVLSTYGLYRFAQPRSRVTITHVTNIIDIVGRRLAVFQVTNHTSGSYYCAVMKSNQWYSPAPRAGISDKGKYPLSAQFARALPTQFILERHGCKSLKVLQPTGPAQWKLGIHIYRQKQISLADRIISFLNKTVREWSGQNGPKRVRLQPPFDPAEMSELWSEAIPLEETMGLEKEAKDAAD